MKKFLSIVLAVVMVFSVMSIAATAAGTYTVTFTELPYDISPYRSDYIGRFQGYEFGTDYWFSLTNIEGMTILATEGSGMTDVTGEPGTTTEIKSVANVTVPEGKSLEFTVCYASYIEPTSIKMLTYPASTAVSSIYDSNTGEPYAQYYIAKSKTDTYGIRPTEDMTVCLSEYHLYNDCFMYSFPSSSYYDAKRVQYNPNGATPTEMYTDFDFGNTKVVYINETMYFTVAIPLDDTAHTYHPGYDRYGNFDSSDTYEVYYTTGNGESMTTTYLRQEDTLDENGNVVTEGFNTSVAHYTTATQSIDVYKIEDISSDVHVKIKGAVTFTFAMLSEYIKEFDIENIDQIDFNDIDLSPLGEYLLRIINLIIKILRGFGLNVNLGSFFK